MEILRRTFGLLVPGRESNPHAAFATQDFKPA
jgi:hypothetical protein